MASPYTDERLIEILRNLAAELGRPPTGKEMLARPGLPSPSTYVCRFGSWSKAKAAAGLDPRRRRRPQIYTDEQLLDILRDLAAELNRPPTQLELAACRDVPSPAAYYSHFGSWNAALEAAGLEARHQHTPAYDDEQLLAILRDLAAELNKTPTCRDLAIRRDLPASSVYDRHFGSWNRALEMVGLEPNRRPKRGAK